MAALPLIVFDVNETVLDLGTMEPTFQRIFDDKSAMRLWFANLILYSAALTVAGCYVPFTDIGAAVMKMLADTRGIKIGRRTTRRSSRKSFPQCRRTPKFRRRCASCAPRASGSSPSPTICLKFKRASLSMAASPICLRRRFSADGVKHHKPSRQAYAYVEKELGAKPSEFCLIACHTWDTLGAVAAGWEAALIKRVGNDVLGVGPQPQIVGNDLNDVADQLIARHKKRPSSPPITPSKYRSGC